MAAKVDLYQEVTNQIIALIEEGNLSFDNGFLKPPMTFSIPAYLTAVCLPA